MSADVQSSVSEKQRYIHPNSLANLNKFQSGESGNPGGVRKGQVFVSECYKRLILLAPDELDGYEPVNVAEEIALRQIKDARGSSPLTPSLPAVKEITDRTEGKAPQRVDITSDVNVNVVQVRVILDAATKLARDHGVSLDIAREWMLAARPELRELVDVK